MEQNTELKVDEFGRRVKSDERLTPVRRYINDMMRDSLQNYPQASPYFELETDKLMDLKDELKAQNKNVTVTSLYTRIMATVLEAYPLLNSAVVYDEKGRARKVTYDSCNVGVGVGMESGIYTVVIKEAQSKNIFEISDELKAKSAIVKEDISKLPLEDQTGSTFTISSIGVQGIRYSTVVLNRPETGMLALGVTEKRPVVLEDDTIGIKRITGFGLTHNHALIDGYHIGAIIDLMRERLNNPMDYMGL